jgi:hypothetical protein
MPATSSPQMLFGSAPPLITSKQPTQSPPPPPVLLVLPPALLVLPPALLLLGEVVVLPLPPVPSSSVASVTVQALAITSAKAEAPPTR